MAGVLMMLPRQYQAAAIAIFDLLIVSYVSASDPGWVFSGRPYS
jgi:hypothetical protein